MVGLGYTLKWQGNDNHLCHDIVLPNRLTTTKKLLPKQQV